VHADLIDVHHDLARAWALVVQWCRDVVLEGREERPPAAALSNDEPTDCGIPNFRHNVVKVVAV
jgi:hypothetical protein